MDPGAWAWLAVWVVAIGAMVWWLAASERRPEPDSPAEILRRRFAAGEISEAEYRHATDVLGTGEQPR